MLRRAVQVGSLAAFVYLFWRLFLPLPGSFPLDLYQRFDLLGFLSSSLAGQVVGVMLWSAGLMLLFAVIFGRAFCGWLCPLGVVVDGVDLIFFRRRMGRKYAGRLRPRWKYYGLVGLAAAAALGAPVAYFAAPLSIALRTLTVVVDAGGRAAWKGLWPWVGQPLWDHGMRWMPQSLTFQGLSFFAAFAVALVALGVLHRRYWCNSLCPLGALLGLSLIHI